jgi:hypothetical protein
MRRGGRFLEELSAESTGGDAFTQPRAVDDRWCDDVDANALALDLERQGA